MIAAMPNDIPFVMMRIMMLMMTIMTVIIVIIKMFMMIMIPNTISAADTVIFVSG